MNEEKSFTSVGINWYPGHMAKTRKQTKLNDFVKDVVKNYYRIKKFIAQKSAGIQKKLKT